MFAVGCIQARRCHTNTCPTGVATQDPKRGRAVDVLGKSLRVKNFHEGTVKSFLEITGAMGCSNPDELNAEHIYQRPEFGPALTHAQIYPPLAPGQLLGKESPEEYAYHWRRASGDNF